MVNGSWVVAGIGLVAGIAVACDGGSDSAGTGEGIGGTLSGGNTSVAASGAGSPAGYGGSSARSTGSAGARALATSGAESGGPAGAAGLTGTGGRVGAGLAQGGGTTGQAGAAPAGGQTLLNTGGAQTQGGQAGSGASVGGTSGQPPAEGGRTGQGGADSRSSGGDTGQGGTGATECTIAHQRYLDALAAAQSCNLSLSMESCGLLPDECGCMHPMSPQGALGIAATDAHNAWASLGCQPRDCRVPCTPPKGNLICKPREAGSPLGVCVWDGE